MIVASLEICDRTYKTSALSFVGGSIDTAFDNRKSQSGDLIWDRRQLESEVGNHIAPIGTNETGTNETGTIETGTIETGTIETGTGADL